MGRTVGIDLGTTYSLIAYHGSANGRAEVYSRAVRLDAVPFGRERRRRWQRSSSVKPRAGAC